VKLGANAWPRLLPLLQRGPHHIMRADQAKTSQPTNAILLRWYYWRTARALCNSSRLPTNQYDIMQHLDVTEMAPGAAKHACVWGRGQPCGQLCATFVNYQLRDCELQEKIE
jgi:hypothetical protein